MIGSALNFLPIVRTAIADALGIEEDEVVPEATLLGDLGAESIDLLDILFRIERVSGVKATVADIGALLQGDIPDEEFVDEDLVVNDTGLSHLERVLPQFDRGRLDQPLNADEVLGLFTTQNLIDLLLDRAGLARAA